MDLLERDTALRELDAALDDATRGEGRVALVSGEAGIGKTALLQRFVGSHRAKVRVLWGGCDALFTPRPLGPLHDIAAQAPTLTALLAGTDRTSLFTAMLAELQGGRTIIAVFEDVHWADEATLDLLRFLGRRIASTRSVLVLTYRDDELGPRHALRPVLGDLATSAATVRIGLLPLTVRGVRVLVGHRSIDADALHRQTAGNPFFVREVLSSTGAGVPLTIREAILGRLAGLSVSAQGVLEAAAVVGSRIDPWLLAAMLPAAAEAADECLASSVLVTEGEGLVFRHELARQTVLEAIPPQRRVLLHRLALEALQAPARGTPDVTRLAHHAVGAADCHAILTYAPAAARHSSAAGAHSAAAALLAMTLPCSDTLSPTALATLLEAYSAECNVIDRRSEGIAARRRAIALWQAVGDHRKHGENLARLVPMLIGVGQNDAADRCSRDAVALLEVLPAGPELALAFRMRALVHLAQRDAPPAVDWANRAIALAEECGDEDVSGMTHVALGSAMMLQDYELGRAYLEERVSVERAAGHATHVGNAFAHLGRQSATLHRFRRAEQYLADGIAYTDGRDLEMYSLYLLAWQSLALMHLGRWREAAAVGQRVVLRAAMSAGNRIPALIALGRLHARGQLGESHSALDEALVLAESIGTAETLGAVRAARAESAWLAGDRARTFEEAGAGYDLAVRQRHPWVAGELAFWRLRILRGLPRWHGEKAQGERPVVETPPDWIAVPFGLQIAGDWRGAAEAWRKQDCPYEEARALADGDTAAQDQALAIFERLGARPAAADLRRVLRARGVIRVARGPRPSTRANLFSLTTRQLEILRLLGEGLNNSEIGQRLSIAPKTAEHHVAAVLAKLKVPSRRAAVRLARSHELIYQDRSPTPPM